MAMIFDGFTSQKQAGQFRSAIATKFQLQTDTWENHKQMHEAWQNETPNRLSDVFPFQLNGWIVTVERATQQTERRVEQIAPHYGGKFAGT